MRLSAFALLPLLFLILLAHTVASRKDAGEYWRMVMKDEAMPEELEGLLHQNSMIQSETKLHSHHHHVKTLNEKCDEDEPLVTTEKKIFTQDIEPRPSITSDNDDFKLQSSSTSYNNGNFGGAEGKRYFKDFESRSSVTSYKNDNLGDEKKRFAKDFEPRPNVLADGDDKVKNDFEPRPNVLVYFG